MQDDFQAARLRSLGLREEQIAELLADLEADVSAIPDDQLETVQYEPVADEDGSVKAQEIR